MQPIYNNNVAAWGDSLTAGAGAVTPPGGWPSQLAALRSGYTVTNLGVGGQNSGMILTRVQADPVRGVIWNSIFEMGRNDLHSQTPTNFPIVVTGNIASAVAHLDSRAKYLVTSVTPSLDEPVGGSEWNEIASLNATLASTYGSKYADVWAALTANGTQLPALNLMLVTATTTATYSSGASSFTVTSATGIVNGMFILGTGIPDQTTITISGTTVTLSTPTTASATGGTVKFVNFNEVHMNDAGYAVWTSTINAAMTANGM